MKKLTKVLAIIMMVTMIMAPAATFAQQDAAAEPMLISEDWQPADGARTAAANQVSIIFSSDMHSHMDSEKVVIDGKTSQRGGMGRTSTTINEIMEVYPDSLLVDGGDFAMGTSYQTVFATEATELRMMGKMGYDATTFGNHEFDYGADGLASMMVSAMDSGDELPPILCANIDWETSLAEAVAPEKTQALKDACDKYNVKDYMMITKGGVDIAVFGLMGIEAASFAPTSGVYFSDPVEASKRVVAEIQANEDADVIVCLSHSGTWESSQIGEVDILDTEDGNLAANVPEIDVIVSGHTHTELPEEVIVGDTAIVSCGAYNYNLGHVILEEIDGEYRFKEYSMIPMDASVKEDEDILKELEQFSKMADERYFSEYGYTTDQVLAKNDIEFTPFDDFAVEQGEDTLGNIISDSYIYAVAEAEGKDSIPVDAAVVPSGVIRSSFFTGDITVSDAFNVSSLGLGPDGKSGYPLVSVYLTGKELKDAAEVDASVSIIMPVARLYMSGLSYDYNTNRMFLNRATDIRLDKGNGQYENLEDDQLYRVVADLYSAEMLGIVKDKSFGLLSIAPKDADGNLITEYRDHIIYNEEGDELKAWYALASYIDSFEGNKVPDKYASLENRKNDVTSWNPVEVVKQPNKVGWIVMAAGIVVILVVIGIIALIRKIARKRKAKKAA